MSEMIRSLFHFVLENYMEDYIDNRQEYREVGQYAASQEQELRQNLSSQDWAIFETYQGNREDGRYQENLALFRAGLALGLELGADYRCR